MSTTDKIHEAFAVWITGLPASGKSTLARALAQRLWEEHSLRVVVLESDELRRILSVSPDYTPAGRDFFYDALLKLGRLILQQGVPVLFDATAHRRVYRQRARHEMSKFLEVYVACPLEVCVGRDPKGIYRRGEQGTTAFVPGLQVAYEPPDEAEVTVHGDREPAMKGAQRVISALRSRGLLD